jgi:murein DD-endopeptidase MepM/ murein hydrolase activator NlpD
VRLTGPVLACAAALAVVVAAPPAVAGPGGGATAPEGLRADGDGGAGHGTAPRRRARSVPARRRQRPAPSGHYFPAAGPFVWGGPGARFGAPRRGHSHQGHDLAAAEGTPVVAPWAGTVETVQYQARGAGHYLVLDGAGEDRDYVFMHLRDRSVRVAAGQAVRAGQQLAEVGNTGSSTGPHLHFEIWVGGWHAGGAPIDPLPLLREWAAG